MKKNSFRAHTPSFMDFTLSDQTFEFEGVEELISKSGVMNRFKALPTFDKFSKSEELIMAEMTDGTHWVMGFVDDPDSIDLPTWVSP